MMGFIELHLPQMGEVPIRPIAVAVERIVDFFPNEKALDCCRVTVDDGSAEGYTLSVQESYDEVIAKLQEFQHSLQAAQQSRRPFVRTRGPGK